MAISEVGNPFPASSKEVPHKLNKQLLFVLRFTISVVLCMNFNLQCQITDWVGLAILLLGYAACWSHRPRQDLCSNKNTPLPKGKETTFFLKLSWTLLKEEAGLSWFSGFFCALHLYAIPSICLYRKMLSLFPWGKRPIGAYIVEHSLNLEISFVIKDQRGGSKAP